MKPDEAIELANRFKNLSDQQGRLYGFGDIADLISRMKAVVDAAENQVKFWDGELGDGLKWYEVARDLRISLEKYHEAIK